MTRWKPVLVPPAAIEDDSLAELQRLADEIFAACATLPREQAVAVLGKAQGRLYAAVEVKQC